ncbi:glycosyltransferase [Neobacillus sp. C211]|uniref:glycosyltransferase n=1 Tax=unclassified Neobacillus TaxID=2675272 RepID=UPI00397DBA65
MSNVIGICVPMFPKLSETFILSQIEQLIYNDYKVRIIAYYPSGEKKQQPIIDELNLLDHTVYVSGKMNLFKRLFRLYNYEDYMLLKKIKQYNLSYNNTSIKDNLRDLLIAKSIIKNGYPQILHCHFGPVAKKYLFIKAIYDIPLIVSFHGIDVLHELSKDPHTYKDVFAKADIITANSNYTANVLRKFGCPSGKLRLLPMGINPDDFHFKTREMPIDQKINITSVGRLVEKKGHEYAIRAMKLLVNKYPLMKYKIAGDGPLKNKLEGIIKELDLENNVLLLGNLDQKEIGDLLDQTHIVLFPSVTARDGDEEGQGVVLLEAQASGIPIVSTFHDGIPESVVEDKTAYLVDERDEIGLSLAIEKMIVDSELWPKMGLHGRNYVKENFTIEFLAKNLIRIYEEILSR